MNRLILVLSMISISYCQYDYPWNNDYDTNFLPEEEQKTKTSTTQPTQKMEKPSQQPEILPHRTKTAPPESKSKQMIITPTTGALFNLGSFQLSTLTFVHLYFYTCF